MPSEVPGPHPEWQALPLALDVRSNNLCLRAVCDLPAPPLFPEVLPWVMSWRSLDRP